MNPSLAARAYIEIEKVKSTEHLKQQTNDVPLLSKASRYARTRTFSESSTGSLNDSDISVRSRSNTDITDMNDNKTSFPSFPYTDYCTRQRSASHIVPHIEDFTASTYLNPDLQDIISKQRSSTFTEVYKK